MTIEQALEAIDQACATVKADRASHAALVEAIRIVRAAVAAKKDA